MATDAPKLPPLWHALQVELDPGETVTLSKKRKIATASTRRYHAGFHRIELQLAGSAHAESGFDLLESS